ncbi:5-formyltetrahydrofolate cyclo-ligase [Lentisphaerota bacterium ZTH]|nr:5-formyltetrahydrofolate cyclo-ligase [Lentisphaerota bacterium]WET06772.1 5-formyltetrahydrofolate cyclo-ligase [Lentisphaerota bacterium ZTH]
MNSAEQKKSVRREFSSRRKSLNPEYKSKADAAINRRICELLEGLSSNLIAAYISDGFEADLSAAIEYCLAFGKKVFLPRYTPKSGIYEMAEISNLTADLVPGKYGLAEPAELLPAASAAELKSMVWLVPGVAFDLSGMRLGRGGGYYDRLLQNAEGTVIGVFYDCQRAVELPAVDHDRRLNMVVTESSVFNFEETVTEENSK